jgi:glycosyltransferase involved in cell wall biosynthesis
VAGEAERLPAARGGGGRVRGALRRGLEILAYRGRIEPWIEAAVAAAPDARLWVGKALVALPVIVGAAERTGGRYVYDVADLHVESGRLAGMPDWLKRQFARHESRLVRQAAGIIAVTPAMAAEVAARHQVQRPVVVMNTRGPWRREEPVVRSPRLRERAGLPTDREIVLYQGAFRPDQGIELLLEALDEPLLAERQLTVVFLGFGVLEERLRAEAAARTGRVVVLPPVPSAELLEWTAGADVSFVGTPPVTKNQLLTTPNKLFESVMAGVPVVVADGTWTSRLVERERLGAVIEPWTAAGLAAGIAGLLDRPVAEREAERAAIRRVALDRLNWDVDRERLVELFRRLA